MSILSTYSPFFLNNSTALNELLTGDTLLRISREKKFRYRKWGEWISIAARKRDSSRPEHVYTRRWESFSENVGLDLFDVLEQVAQTYLMVQNARLYVKEEISFARWQNMRSRMSTLPVKTRALFLHNLPPSPELVHPCEPELEDYISTHGLNEPHLHAMACEYPEELWLRFLASDFADFYRLYQGYKTYSQLQQLYATINPQLTVESMLMRARLARFIRSCIINELQIPLSQRRGKYIEYAWEVVLGFIKSQMILGHEPYVCYPHDKEGRIRQELWMWQQAFLSSREGTDYEWHLQQLLHLYLLIENENIQLNRQGEMLRGFSSFNKNSLHQRLYIRKPSDIKELMQWLKTKTRAKENTCVEIRSSFYIISNYHKEIIEHWRKAYGENAPKLILVMHFSKDERIDEGQGRHLCPNALYEPARKKYLYEAKRFGQYARNIMKRYKVPVAIDAAGTEQKISPEAFAPAYRLFERSTKISYKTYHCGEDFYHLIGGIRAVYDAVMILDLKNGNRVGHATAIGIHPRQWLKDQPAKLVLKRREWLLNLVFAWRILREARKRKPKDIARISLEAIHQAHIIFQDDISMELLEGIYDARSLEPRQVKNYIERSRAPLSMGKEEAELVRDFQKERGRLVLEYFTRWNYNAEVRNHMEERIEIDSGFLDEETLLILQQEVQRILKERQVVIETLPVSNVRISQYESIRQHHALRWMGIPGYALDGDEQLDFCMGSDDPGIFVTDLLNEYYHLFCNLRNAGLTPSQAMDKLMKVNDIGRIYAFRQLPLQYTGDASFP